MRLPSPEMGGAVAAGKPEMSPEAENKTELSVTWSLAVGEGVPIPTFWALAINAPRTDAKKINVNLFMSRNFIGF